MEDTLRVAFDFIERDVHRRAFYRTPHGLTPGPGSARDALHLRRFAPTNYELRTTNYQLQPHANSSALIRSRRIARACCTRLRAFSTVIDSVRAMAGYGVSCTKRSCAAARSVAGSPSMARKMIFRTSHAR